MSTLLYNSGNGAKKVSILSPNYNGSKYLKSFLQSVLEQTYNNIELIIVDDASNDDSLDIIESFKRPFFEKGMILKSIKLERNSGQAAAINVALKLFTGFYVMWMDSDDILFTNAITKKVEYMEGHPEIEFCLCQGVAVNDDNLDFSIRLLKREKTAGKETLFEDVIAERNIVYGNGSSFVRADALRRSIPSMHIFESREGQNLQLLLPLAYNCSIGYIEEPLFKYVIHSDSHFHKERTYEQRIIRWNGIEAILKETIKAIESMSDAEKDYWFGVIDVRIIKEKMYCSTYYGDLSNYKELKKRLKQMDGKITIRQSYFFERTRLIKNRYKRAIKNILNKVFMSNNEKKDK